jgi:DNA-binding NtrC family response regulator
VAVNCGGLSETLLESELFGHEKGSFTGASRTRRGFFELAHGGTLFLDEVSELPLHLQVKLLHVLETKQVQPVGAERAIPVDVRFMAATNRDLAAEVEARRFRQDLFYRLNVVSLLVPPLRERRLDVPELVQSYIDHFHEALHTPTLVAAPDALAVLTRYSWPGNVRELINAIERSVIMCESEELGVADLPLDVLHAVEGESLDVSASGAPDPTQPVDRGWADKTWSQVRALALEETERRYLTAILETCEGRVGEAAERAGIAPRSLYEKMKHHGLRKEDFRGRRDRR